MKVYVHGQSSESVEGDLLRVVSCSAAQSHYSYNPDGRGLIIVSDCVQDFGRLYVRCSRSQFTIYNYNFIFRRKTARERMTNADDIIHYNILLYTVLLVYRER